VVTCDGAGASHGLIARLNALASRPGHQLIYSVGWDLGERERTAIRLVPRQAWQAAVDHRGEVRERRADDACTDASCSHHTCWVEEAHVAELTALLRSGRAGDQLTGWPPSMRVFARRERPHPGAQLTLFETEDGWRYSLWVTNLPERTPGWRGQPAYIDAAHRIHARVEDCVPPGKTPGSAASRQAFALNQAWLAAALIAATLLAWLRHLALDGHLAKAEPKDPALPHPARRRPPDNQRTAAAPENRRHLALGAGDHDRLEPDHRHGASTLTGTEAIPAIKEGTPGPVEPPAIRPASRPLLSRDPKIKFHYAARRLPQASDR
jgi:hypothetical protein